MKTLTSIAVFAALSLVPLAAGATEVPTLSPLTVTFEKNRQQGDTWVFSTTVAADGINYRLANSISDSWGWKGIAKLPLKVGNVCTSPEAFKGVVLSGLTITMTKVGSLETYTVHITRVLCG